MFILAGPMLVSSAFLTAFAMTYILGYDGEFTWTASVLFGAVVSATDPVAVVALLKELGASRRLATLIEGESLLNDGTAMVMFSVVLVSQLKCNSYIGNSERRRSKCWKYHWIVHSLVNRRSCIRNRLGFSGILVVEANLQCSCPRSKYYNLFKLLGI